MDKMAGPKASFSQRSHCNIHIYKGHFGRRLWLIFVFFDVTIISLIFLIWYVTINRFDQVFLLVLDQVQPLCQSEQKFCNSFFHFPRDEDDSQISVS